MKHTRLDRRNRLLRSPWLSFAAKGGGPALRETRWWRRIRGLNGFGFNHGDHQHWIEFRRHDRGCPNPDGPGMSRAHRVVVSSLIGVAATALSFSLGWGFWPGFWLTLLTIAVVTFTTEGRCP